MFKALTAATLLVSSLSVGAAPDRQITLTTGVMYAPVSSGAFLVCNAVNVTEAPVTVTLELIDANGLVAGAVSGALAPRGDSSVFSGSRSSSYCRVTVQGPAASVRASICNWQNYSCISNLEAR